MIIPNIPITVIKHSGYDIYGQEQLGASYSEKCCVVKMLTKSQTTTVRVDSGATRHSAFETIADVVLLLPTTTHVEIEDIIATPHVRVRVRSKHARYTVTGKFDHWEVGCEIE